MNFYEHCNLCINYKSNLQDGLTCGLTNKKPAFNRTCSKIELSEEFKWQLGLIHINIERLKKKKKSTYIYSFLHFAIGCVLIISQRNVFIGFDLTYKQYSRMTPFLLIIAVGFGLLGLAYRELHQFRVKTKIVKTDKNRIDAVLNKYHVKYSCNVQFVEKHHGNQEAVVKLKSKSDLLKNTELIYEI